MTIGCPIFYGEKAIILIYGYSHGNLVYASGVVDTEGWQFDKSWKYYLPGGLDAVSVYTLDSVQLNTVWKFHNLLCLFRMTPERLGKLPLFFSVV